VLEPFGQVANQFNRDHDGTGLGLPLARAFAALHGATLEIDSAVGRGTTVRVRFPAHRRLTPRPPPPPLMPGYAAAGPARPVVVADKPV
jgi:K+-sensing histidine kinase KdpD